MMYFTCVDCGEDRPLLNDDGQCFICQESLGRDFDPEPVKGAVGFQGWSVSGTTLMDNLLEEE